MTRPEAIEAAADALGNWGCTCQVRGYGLLLCGGCGKVVNEGQEADRLGGEVVSAATPYIESALLDRIEEKIEAKAREWDEEAKRDAAYPDHCQTDIDRAAGLREALGVLTQIREEAGSPGKENNDRPGSSSTEEER